MQGWVEEATSPGHKPIYPSPQQPSQLLLGYPEMLQVIKSFAFSQQQTRATPSIHLSLRLAVTHEQDLEILKILDSRPRSVTLIHLEQNLCHSDLLNTFSTAQLTFGIAQGQSLSPFFIIYLLPLG